MTTPQKGKGIPIPKVSSSPSPSPSLSSSTTTTTTTSKSIKITAPSPKISKTPLPSPSPKVSTPKVSDNKQTTQVGKQKETEKTPAKNRKRKASEIEELPIEQPQQQQNAVVPHVPKKAPTAYIMFHSDQIAKYKDLSFSDKNAQIGEDWKQADEKTKLEYHRKAAVGKLAYQKEFAAYVDKYGYPFDDSDNEEHKKTPSTKKEPTAYNLFMQKNRKKLAEENPGATFGELAVLIGQAWRNLPIEMREHLKQEAKGIIPESKVDHEENNTKEENNNNNKKTTKGKEKNKEKEKEDKTPAKSPSKQEKKKRKKKSPSPPPPSSPSPSSSDSE